MRTLQTTIKPKRCFTNVRDHRTHTTPPPVSNGGGVTVTSVPRKSKTTQPGYNPVPGAGPWY
jgi:hypothetical protein